MTRCFRRILLTSFLFFGVLLNLNSQASNPKSFLLVELNCENFFDCSHDSLKQDSDFLPDGVRHWTRTKYWRKQNRVGQTILSCSEQLPDLVALCEVENDTVLHDLTHRSLLRNAGYEYLMTESPDVRGMDVALLYQPATFRPICYESIEVPPLRDMRPTRDILYVKGETRQGDTLHVFIVHAPSRYGGKLPSEPNRLHVSSILARYVEPLVGKRVIVAGDFNDYATDRSLRQLEHFGLLNVTGKARGSHGAKANYRHEGLWGNLDHVLVSPSLRPMVDTAYVHDAPFLLEEEPVYGGCRPRRTFRGYRYQHGFSDHLPLVVRFRWEKP